MATLAEARRIALALPATSEKVSWGSLHWRVRDKGFAWERPLNRTDLAALGDDAPTGEIVAVRVADLGERDALIAAEPEVFFTVPHLDGFPAVLVRLAAVDVTELTELITDAWLDRAPKTLRETFLRGRGEPDASEG
ncbi:MmcQ/YjbR family DNA-binding protein [Microlunatus antarcticus]